jgi:hypothetical protein
MEQDLDTNLNLHAPFPLARRSDEKKEVQRSACVPGRRVTAVVSIPKPYFCGQMSSRWQLDQQYANLMKNHPFGIALYRPPPQSAFKPGVCGYFDGFGEWNSIAQLDDPDSLNSMGLSPVREELQKAPRENIKWGPKTAEFVRVKKISLSAGMYVVVPPPF